MSACASENNAIVVPTQNRQGVTLVSKDGKATCVCTCWYNELNNVHVPTLYINEHKLIRGTHDKRICGKETRVRKWNKVEWG